MAEARPHFLPAWYAMAEARPHFLPAWDAKRWDPLFSNDRDIEDSSHWREKRRNIRRSDELSFLLDDLEEPDSSCLSEEVREFCRDEQVEDFESGQTNPEGQRQAAWLDERAWSGSYRQHIDLSAIALYHRLQKPVC